MNLTDDFKHKGLRRRMIAELKELLPYVGNSVFEAMEKVPRHLFVGDSVFLPYAYKADSAFQIGKGQTISRATTVAIQSELLMVQKTDTILEIGTGSGYQTAVLCELGAKKIFSIERQKLLFDKTLTLLKDLKYKATLLYGDGYKGLPAFAPFDKIIVTCGATEIPDALLQQVKIGGTLVIPVGDEQSQEMVVVHRLSEDEFTEEKFGKFAFVPMLQDKEKK